MPKRRRISAWHNTQRASQGASSRSKKNRNESPVEHIPEDPITCPTTSVVTVRVLITLQGTLNGIYFE